MLGPVVDFLKNLLSLGSNFDFFVALCLDHPIWAIVLATIVFGMLLYLTFIGILQVFNKLSPLIGYTGIFIWVSLAIALAGGAVLLVNVTMPRVPAWVNLQDVYIGEPINLLWKYDVNPDAVFEIQYARDEQYGIEVKSLFTDVYKHQPYSRQVEDVRNGRRYFRVRAVDPHAKDHPLSDWSATRRIAQYDSSLRRIVATDTIIIGISKIDHNDLFKWRTVEVDGIDIRLVKAIVAELPARIGKSHPLEIRFVRMAWDELLAAPAHAAADLVLAAISRGAERELQYGISFSEPYFCTTQALLFLAGNRARTVLEMIDGNRIGFEKPSTSERMVTALIADAKLRQVKPPQPREYPRPKDVISKLKDGEIDVGVTDLPFAAEAVLVARGHGDNLLSYKPFEGSDLPSSLPKENRLDEYAISMRRGDALARFVNDILAEMKSTGALTHIIQTATSDYERLNGFVHGSLAQSILKSRPYECQ
jgi:ABC-type amino acid transport substrate-binding protein